MHRYGFREFFSIGVLLLIFVPVLAQSTRPSPPKILHGISISMESAKAVAGAAIAEAQKNRWAMAIAIVDTGGYLVYFERTQDTQTGSVDLAIEKGSYISTLQTAHQSL